MTRLARFSMFLALFGCTPPAPACTEGQTQTCVCSTTSMGAQVCVEGGTWGTCVCAADDAGTGDAGTGLDATPIADAGSDASADVTVPDDTAGCDRVGFGGTAGVTSRGANDNVTHVIDDGTDRLLIDVYLGVSIFEGMPQTIPLTGENYDICAGCVLMYEGCFGEACERTYLAQSGTLDLTEIDRSNVVGTLEDVRLIEVTVDTTTNTSTPVPDGRVWCLGDRSFEGRVP